MDPGHNKELCGMMELKRGAKHDIFDWRMVVGISIKPRSWIELSDDLMGLIVVIN